MGDPKVEILKNEITYNIVKEFNLQIDEVLSICESEIEKLKVPFFRGSNAANVKGFGLGLSIVQRIITLHHGSFEYSFIEPFTNRFTTSFKAGA